MFDRDSMPKRVSCGRALRSVNVQRFLRAALEVPFCRFLRRKIDRVTGRNAGCEAKREGGGGGGIVCRQEATQLAAKGLSGAGRRGLDFNLKMPYSCQVKKSNLFLRVRVGTTGESLVPQWCDASGISADSPGGLLTTFRLIHRRWPAPRRH